MGGVEERVVGERPQRERLQNEQSSAIKRGTSAGAVIVAVDSEPALPAVHWAAEECARIGATLQLVHYTGVQHAGTAPNPAPDMSLLAASARDHAPGIAVGTEVLPGEPAARLIERSAGARMIVLAGPTGTDGGRRSTAWAAASHSRCPLVVWRPISGRGPSSPVIVGLDGSPVSADALTFAVTEASWRRVPLVAVMAWSDVFLDTDRHVLGVVTDPRAVSEGHRRLLAEQLSGVQERFPDVSIERVLAHDRPVRALLKEAATAQLLVVGSHGRGGFPGMLLGSVSQALIDCAPCPLAVVRPSRIS